MFATSKLAHGMWDQVDIEQRQEPLQGIVFDIRAREALWLRKSMDRMVQQSRYEEGRSH